MPTTKAAPKKAAKASTTRRSPTASRPKTRIDRTTELSDDVLKAVESGQRAAIDAVHTFVDRVERALPHGEEPSRRQEVLDSALEMADRLVKTQYEFVRKVVDSASRTFDGPGKGK